MGCLYTLSFPNGKVYVGITSKSAEVRFAEHAKRCTRSPVSDAIRAFEKDRVKLSVALCSDDWAELCAAERKTIKELGSLSPDGYNLTEGGDGSPGYKFTSEQRAALSIALKGKLKVDSHCAALAKAAAGKNNFAGHRHTEESKAKIADSYRGKGMLGKKHSEAAKAKISAARRSL